ncbi:MAG: alpha/beta fold hydrolase [Microvirga sp.]
MALLHVLGLEVVSEAGSDPSARPIVLVHGAWHAASCWGEGFMARLASRGGDVHALSLRGHGASAGRDRLKWHRIRDYVDDLRRVVDAIDGIPVLVGHSMGGYVVRKYLEEAPRAAAAVLLAPVPRHGAAGINWRFLRANPMGSLTALRSLSLWPLVSTPAKARAMFLSGSVPDEDAGRRHDGLQDESFRAYLDLLGLDRCRSGLPAVPILVLGAGDDALFTPQQIEGVARACGTTAEIFPGMAHDMMLEPGWETVADRIVAWVRSTVETASPAIGSFRT